MVGFLYGEAEKGRQLSDQVRTDSKQHSSDKKSFGRDTKKGQEERMGAKKKTEKLE